MAKEVQIILFLCLLLSIAFAIRTLIEIVNNDETSTSLFVKNGGVGSGTEIDSSLLNNNNNNNKTIVIYEIINCRQNIIASITTVSKIGLLNDNFCDCEFGEDEPLTDACSNIKVHTLNFKCNDSSKVIFSSRVNDGIFDCPDKSDEYDNDYNTINNRLIRFPLLKGTNPVIIKNKRQNLRRRTGFGIS